MKTFLFSLTNFIGLLHYKTQW